MNVVELDVLVGIGQRLRLVGRAHRLRQEIRRGDGHHVRQFDRAFGRHRLLRFHVQQVLRDRRAQLAILRIVIHGLAIARPRQVHAELRSQRGARSGRQRDDAIGQQQRLVHVVGHQHDRLLLLAPDGFDFVLQFGARQRIERRQRLVEQQEFRIHRERARHGHALAHAARELRGTPVGGVCQAHHAHVLFRARAPLGLVFLGKHRIDRQRHVFEHREPGHQRVALEHQAAIRARRTGLLAAKPHFARVRLDEPGENRHERGLARA